MAIAIASSLLFVLISLVLRFAYYRFPIDKMKASTFSFIFAAVATTVCTVLLGSQQYLFITGFITMLLCYSILVFQPYKL